MNTWLIKKEKRVIVIWILAISFCMFICMFIASSLMGQETSIATFYLYFLVLSLELFISFFLSCYLKYKIWGNVKVPLRACTKSP